MTKKNENPNPTQSKSWKLIVYLPLNLFTLDSFFPGSIAEIGNSSLLYSFLAVPFRFC